MQMEKPVKEYMNDTKGNRKEIFLSSTAFRVLFDACSITLSRLNKDIDICFTFFSIFSEAKSHRKISAQSNPSKHFHKFHHIL